MSINANEEFYAASLFKMPVFMAYYHGKERTKSTDDPLIKIKEEQTARERTALVSKKVYEFVSSVEE